MQQRERRNLQRARSADEVEEDLVEEDQLLEEEEEKNADQSFESSYTSKRGRPKIPDSWTRVMHVTPELDHRGKEHWISSDLMLQRNLIEKSQVA